MLSIALTVTGLVAALWYMAWWIGVVALVVALGSTALVAAVFMHTQPRESAAEKRGKAPLPRLAGPAAVEAGSLSAPDPGQGGADGIGRTGAGSLSAVAGYRL